MSIMANFIRTFVILLEGNDQDEELTDNEDEDTQYKPAPKRVRTESPPVIASVWYEDPQHEWYCPDNPEESVPMCFQSYVNATVAKVAYDPDHPTLR
jgi:hypothetical protein